MEFSDAHPGDTPHPGGKGTIAIKARILSKTGDVVVDFNELQDLIGYRDSLTTEAPNGSFTLTMRALTSNFELLKKVHPGMVIEVYAARNADPIIGAHPDPSQIEPGWTYLEPQEVTVPAGGSSTAIAGSVGGDHIPTGEQGTVAAIDGGKLLGAPYYSQRDNAINPSVSCNATSIAQAAGFYGIRAQGSGQLEDEFTAWIQERGLDPGAPDTLVQLAAAHGMRSRFTPSADFDEIRAHLDSGNPVVVHGYFTGPGHIVTVVGYNQNGFIVNDPWGDWKSGYGDTNGENVVYPYDDMQAVLQPEGAGNTYAHFMTRSGG
jgi:hypothetical protein